MKRKLVLKELRSTGKFSNRELTVEAVLDDGESIDDAYGTFMYFIDNAFQDLPLVADNTPATGQLQSPTSSSNVTAQKFQGLYWYASPKSYSKDEKNQMYEDITKNFKGKYHKAGTQYQYLYSADALINKYAGCLVNPETGKLLDSPR